MTSDKLIAMWLMGCGVPPAPDGSASYDGDGPSTYTAGLDIPLSYDGPTASVHGDPLLLVGEVPLVDTDSRLVPVLVLLVQVKDTDTDRPQPDTDLPKVDTDDPIVQTMEQVQQTTKEQVQQVEDINQELLEVLNRLRIKQRLPPLEDETIPVVLEQPGDPLSATP